MILKDSDKKLILIDVVDTALKKFFDEKFFKGNDRNKGIEFRDGRLLVKFLVHEYDYDVITSGFMFKKSVITKKDNISQTTNQNFSINPEKYIIDEILYELNYSKKNEKFSLESSDKHYPIIKAFWECGFRVSSKGLKKLIRYDHAHTGLEFDNNGEVIIENEKILGAFPNGYIFRYEFPDKIDEFLKIFMGEFRKHVKVQYCNEIKFAQDNLIKKDKEKTDKSIYKFLKDYDKDKSGSLDLTESNGFSDLLKKYQKDIIEVDKVYIQNFVKLSSFLKKTSDELDRTFHLITQSQSSKDFEDHMYIFSMQYQAFTTILLHSYNMILSLIRAELIEFYEIYEVFDELHIFDNKYEKTMINKLDDLIESNISLEKNIIKGFDRIELSIDRMNESLTRELKGINNKLWWNNAFQMVQIFQKRRFNKKLLS
tara:strand:- start:275 stop:1555 length:1281 start_codon:yes stop_codon:yes gene_type:complete